MLVHAREMSALHKINSIYWEKATRLICGSRVYSVAHKPAATIGEYFKGKVSVVVEVACGYDLLHCFNIVQELRIYREMIVRSLVSVDKLSRG